MLGLGKVFSRQLGPTAFPSWGFPTCKLIHISCADRILLCGSQKCNKKRETWVYCNFKRYTEKLQIWKFETSTERKRNIKEIKICYVLLPASGFRDVFIPFFVELRLACRVQNKKNGHFKPNDFFKFFNWNLFFIRTEDFKVLPLYT